MMLATLGRGQVSTFPNPPPLAPQSDQLPGESANPPTAPTAPDATQNDKSSGAATDTFPKAQPTPITAATLTSMAALDDKVPLEPGDTISFRVIEDRDDAIQRVVTDTGEVDFPYINRVKVEGKTCFQVAQEVKKLLEVDYYKQATVIVGLDLILGSDKTKAKDMAWVVGEVKAVGPFELVKAQPMTVSQLILRAGGFGDFADQRKVKLVHRGPNSAASEDSKPPDLDNAKDEQVIDVKSIFDGKSTNDPLVQPGDYVIVPKRFFNY